LWNKSLKKINKRVRKKTKSTAASDYIGIILSIKFLGSSGSEIFAALYIGVAK
jgi:hypothetical protein